MTHSALCAFSDALSDTYELLVTERQRLGAFRTAAPEVLLVCREALRAYLEQRCPSLNRAALLALLYDTPLPHAVLPPAVALELYAALHTITVCDPCVGAGVFPLAMLRLLHQLLRRLAYLLVGYTPLVEAVAHGLLSDPQDAEALATLAASRLWACDVNPLAVEFARLRLRLETLALGGRVPNLEQRIVVADALLDTPPWDAPPAFALVLGNPPYVRHEQIPLATKRRLLKRFQGMQPAPALTARADLYVYFFLRGVTLLEQAGILCYICAGSWLDVAYGSGLRAWLLRNTQILAIYDNAAARSFAAASVNTSIALLQRNPCPPDDHIARFVLFQRPYASLEIQGALNLLLAASEDDECDQWRLALVPQSQLGSGGTAPAWSGPYLRSGRVLRRLLEQVRPQLVPLHTLANVRFGIKTGANEFFYLDEARATELAIEEQFLRPILFSLREIKGIEAPPPVPRYRLFSCHAPIEQLTGTAALRYIQYGEAQGIQRRPSCAIRPHWYSVGAEWVPAPFVVPAKIGERFVVLHNQSSLLEDKKLYGLTPRIGPVAYWGAVLNSSFCRLLLELSCRQLTGAQPLADLDVRVVATLPLPPLALFDPAALEAAYAPLRQRAVCPRLRDELAMPDRCTLDALVLNALGLASSDHDAIREALLAIVAGRLSKAVPA